MPLPPAELRLMADLQAAARGRAVACVGCPLAVRRGEAGLEGLMLLLRPPLAELPVLPSQVLVAVLPSRLTAPVAELAELGVPESWLVDRAHGWLERLHTPRAGAYRHRGLVLPGESLAPQALPGARVTWKP